MRYKFWGLAFNAIAIADGFKTLCLPYEQWLMAQEQPKQGSQL